MSTPFDPPRRPRPKLREGPVQQYRCYFLGGIGSRFTRSHEFEAADDAKAMRIAEAWREGRPMELWCGSRMVKTWDRDR
jgi:hypothetical protein